MAGPAMTYSMVDYADVQGLVRFGYGRMTSASYALVRVKNVAAAKAWLRAAPVTNAVEKATADHGPADRVHGARPESAWLARLRDRRLLT